MKKSSIVMAVAVVALTVAGSQCFAAPKATKHLLVVTHTAAFRHDSIPTAEEVLADLGAKSGIYDVDYARDEAEVKQKMSVAALKAYDGVVFANTTGNLGIPDLHGFLDWLKTGKGFVGMHSASDTYHPSEVQGDRSYVEMLGGEFRTHRKQCSIEAIVNDLKHPAVKQLGKSWTIFDEIYLFKENNRPDVHVLLSTTTDPCADTPAAGDFLVSWVKDYGKGRVFYTSLGHRIDVWENPVYQQHILHGIKWALKLEKGSAKPDNPAPPIPR
ncbi:MAG: ThuA domain-containing protein [Armatimonadetes bacterium]|nr:ThuA domain-containing protein [Armatimonadota bacterium]